MLTHTLTISVMEADSWLATVFKIEVKGREIITFIIIF